jgi:hypothetical protein
MAISNDILSSTLRILLDYETDNLFKAVPLLDQMKKQGGVEYFDGGQKVDVPLILAEHSTITQLSTGYEPVNLAVQDALRNASYNWCDFVAPIVINKKEELSNRGDRAIVSIAEARMKSVMGLLKREFEKQTIAGTSTILSDLNTLNGGVAGGFLEDIVVGSQTNTVGGIAKSSFPNDYQNQFVDSNSAFATGATTGISDLTNLYISAQVRTPDGGAPNLLLVSPALYKNYKKLLFTNERFIDEKTLDGGRIALAFNGAMMFVDPNLPCTGKIGASSISGYALNTKHMHLAMDSEADFTMSDFEFISGYAARSANVFVRAQLYVDHLGSQGVIARAET